MNQTFLSSEIKNSDFFFLIALFSEVSDDIHDSF